MGRYDTMILPRERERKLSFGEALKAGLGQSLGQLPSNIIDTGFQGLSNYLVNSKLTGKRGEEDRKTQEAIAILKTKESLDAAKRQIEAQKAAAKNLLEQGPDKASPGAPIGVKNNRAQEVFKSLAGLLKPKNSEPDTKKIDIPGNAVTENRPAPKVEVVNPQSETTKTMARTTLRYLPQTGKLASDVIDEVFPNARRAAEAGANRTLETFNTGGEYQRATSRGMRRMPAETSDYEAEWDAAHPNYNPNNIDSRLQRTREITEAVSRDQDFMANLGNADAVGMTSTLEGSAAKNANEYAGATQKLQNEPASIARAAMNNLNAQESLYQQRKGRSGPRADDNTLQKVMDAIDTRLSLLANRKTKLKDPQLSPDEKWELQKLIADDENELKRHLQNYNRIVKSNPQAVANRAVALKRVSEEEKMRNENEQKRLDREARMNAAAEIEAGRQLGLSANREWQTEEEILDAMIHDQTGAYSPEDIEAQTDRLRFVGK